MKNSCCNEKPFVCFSPDIYSLLSLVEDKGAIASENCLLSLSLG